MGIIISNVAKSVRVRYLGPYLSNLMPVELNLVKISRWVSRNSGENIDKKSKTISQTKKSLNSIFCTFVTKSFMKLFVNTKFVGCFGKILIDRPIHLICNLRIVDLCCESRITYSGIN